MEPAFAVLEGKLILSTREDYLLEILRTIKGEARSVADSPEFRAAMGPLAPDATLAFFVHGKNLLDLAWDYRNDHVHTVGDATLKQHLLELRLRLQGQNRTLTTDDLDKLNDQVDAEADRYRRQEYGRYIDDYRRFLDGCRRLSSAGFVLEARSHDQRLNVGAAVQFTPPGR